MRLDNIIGVDIHYEYHYYFNYLSTNTFDFTDSILNSCFGMIYIPIYYLKLLNSDPLNTFKIVFPIIFSITPLAIFEINLNFLEKKLSFISVFFYIFQSTFLWIGYYPRTSLAIIFFIALVYIILLLGQHNYGKVLFIIFFFSLLMSHYSTTYIFLFVYISAYILMSIHNSLRPKKIRSVYFSYGLFLIIMASTFIWHSQISNIPFNSAITFISKSFEKIITFSEFGLRSNSARYVTGNIGNNALYEYCKLLLHWIIILFCAIGILMSIINKKTKKSMIGYSISNIILILASVSFFLMAISVIMPFLSLGYGIERIYMCILPTLIVFIIKPVKYISKYINVTTSNLLIIILLVVAIFSMQLPVFNSNQNIYSSDISYFNDITVSEIELEMIDWAEFNINDNIYVEEFVRLKIYSQSKIDTSRIKIINIDSQFELPAYNNLYLLLYKDNINNYKIIESYSKVYDNNFNVFINENN